MYFFLIKVASVVHKKSTLLLIGSKGSTDSKEHGEIIEVWSHTGEGRFKQIDCIPTVNLTSMSTIVGPNSNSFLALASGQIQEHSGSVYIYK